MKISRFFRELFYPRKWKRLSSPRKVFRFMPFDFPFHCTVIQPKDEFIQLLGYVDSIKNAMSRAAWPVTRIDLEYEEI